MSPDKHFVSVIVLVNALRHWCNERRSGTVFFVSDDSHAGFFCLREGKVVYLNYHGSKNKTALQKMQSISKLSYRIDEQQRFNLSTSEFEHNEFVFSSLSGKSAGLEASITEPADLGALVSEGISATSKDRLEQALVEYIGPMAAIVCQEVFAQKSSFDNVVNDMASRIPNRRRAQEFMQQAMDLKNEIDGVGYGDIEGTHATPAIGTTRLNENFCVSLKALLADYIGPIADIVCDPIFATADQPEQAIRLLAEKIPETGQSEQFIQAAEQLLK